VRGILKGLLETGLLHGGPAALSRVKYRGRGLILAYHNVVSDEHAGVGDSALHVPLTAFRAQIAALRESAAIVPLAELLARTGSEGTASSAGRPRVAVTFDDAYRGAITLALPELVRHDMPATVFVSPRRLGGQAFWWDRFAAEAGASPTSQGATFRETALTECSGDENRVADWASDRGWRGATLPDALLSADTAELDEVARLPGVTLASHTWSHPNLTRLDDAALREELMRSLAWLEDRDGDTARWLAYPYGIFDDRVAAAAAEAGYEAALRVGGGWLPRERPDPFRLPRLNVPAGVSQTGFRLRLAGLLGDG
jgi:peptidoglycan/xylan/chitin deacetylase (PgdA/CDA1 family)